MAKGKESKKRTSAPPMVEQRESTKSPHFVSVYSNDVQVQTSPWDMRLMLGEMTSAPSPEDPVVRITQLAEVRLSPPLAKRLAEIMVLQIKAYEDRFGDIPVPPNT